MTNPVPYWCVIQLLWRRSGRNMRGNWRLRRWNMKSRYSSWNKRTTSWLQRWVGIHENLYLHVSSLPELKVQVNYCDHRTPGFGLLSVYCLWPIYIFDFSRISWLNFEEDWKWWSAFHPSQVLLLFGQICTGVDPGQSEVGWRMVPILTNIFMQFFGKKNTKNKKKSNCIAMI